MSDNSVIHAFVVTATNNVPCGVTDNGSVTLAICGPTSLCHSGITFACATRSAIPACLRTSDITSLSFRGGRFFFSLTMAPSSRQNATALHSTSLQRGELFRNVRIARNGEHGLSEADLAQQPEHSCRPTGIELGEGIVEQEDRRRAAGVAQRFGLERSKCERRGSLLTGGSELAQLA